MQSEDQLWAYLEVKLVQYLPVKQANKPLKLRHYNVYYTRTESEMVEPKRYSANHGNGKVEENTRHGGYLYS